MLKEGTFSYHHQPLAYFARFQPGTLDRTTHLKDLQDFSGDIDRGTLPAVAFYKPRRGINQHPSASDVVSSDRHAGEILQRLERSPQWPKMLVILTYDENGGFWDHVAPPARDRFGPGAIVAPEVAKSVDGGHHDGRPGAAGAAEARFPVSDAWRRPNSSQR